MLLRSRTPGCGRKDDTTIIEGAGKKGEVAAGVSRISGEIENATGDSGREQLQGRGAKLVGGVAKILAGGATESEAKQKKMRFGDALDATQAAMEEGIVPGGGVAC